jgi:DNA-binding CsgD family transcriptional regulator
MGNIIAFECARKPARAQSSFRLSPREAEIVSMAYMSNADIAEILGISLHTVRATLRTAFVKLGVDKRTAAYEAVEMRAA